MTCVRFRALDAVGGLLDWHLRHPSPLTGGIGRGTEFDQWARDPAQMGRDVLLSGGDRGASLIGPAALTAAYHSSADKMFGRRRC